MKFPRHISAILLFVITICGPADARLSALKEGVSSDVALAGPEEYFYGIEMNGTVCGYIRFDLTRSSFDDGEKIVLKEYMFADVSALGSRFESRLWLTYHIDPVTWQYTYHDGRLHHGHDLKMDSKVMIESGSALFTSTESDGESSTEIPPGTILENTLFFPHLRDDFAAGNLVSKTYEIFDVREQAVHSTTYRFKGIETLDLGGKSRDAISLEEVDQVNGMRISWWIDRETGMLLKAEMPGGRKSFLSDEQIVKKIEMGNLTSALVTATNVSIGDIRSISYMKVRAVIEPVGLWVEEGSLNVPGQRFEGTVTENRIEGIFEIEHRRYNGENAPPFPPLYAKTGELAGWLKPDDFIGSDDPVIVEKAVELTAGASDSWDAAVRISEWVASNIRYEIPGGITARGTYDCLCGECGAHSILLAAFCRAVGIPARVVWGSMYVPNFNGAFGQHAWSEIYMGEVGWIPVDATAMEPDFLDSGHIRLGEYSSPSTALNGVSFDILDHRILSGRSESPGEEDGISLFAGLTGDYTGEEGKIFAVTVENARLTVDIPGQVKLALNDPDGQGRRFATISNTVFVTFEDFDDHGQTGAGEYGHEGEASTMLIHQFMVMPRTSEPDSIPTDAPEGLKGYLGGYTLKAMNAEFIIFLGEGILTVHDPLNGIDIGLQQASGTDRFIDEKGKNYLTFKKDSTGDVVSVEFELISRFTR